LTWSVTLPAGNAHCDNVGVIEPDTSDERNRRNALGMGVLATPPPQKQSAPICQSARLKLSSIVQVPADAPADT
jgi:hypothetical protein